MRKLKLIFLRYKELGFMGALKSGILTWLGINKQQEEIDTLFYFLNKYNDITKLPPTTNDNMRIMQKCDADALAIFDKLCQKYGLTYWLDYGTLLGAVRHKGFIPWDDDIDITMPREDFEKIVPLLKEKLEVYGFEIDERKDYPMRFIGLGYMHSKTGIWIDIFPSDVYYYTANIDETKREISKAVNIYRNYYWSNKNKQSVELIAKKKSDIMKSFSNGAEMYILRLMESKSPLCVNKSNDVYPLCKLEFDGYKLNAPCNYKQYLSGIYGESYMSFPKGGVEHHGGVGTGRDYLYNWAENNGVDMNEIHSRLKMILSTI